MACAASRRAAGVLSVPLLLLALAASAADAGSGQSLYRDGLRAAGEPLRATVQKGVALSGADAACVKCHRRSGLGGSEGQNPIRPIAGRLLFAPSQGEPARRRGVAAGGTGVRPAYTAASLARALREGIDPAGRALDPLMPRYALDDGEIAQLQTYLEGLSAAPGPGVGADEIHFATIIAPDVAPERRKAMLDVMQGFVRDKNAGTRLEARRRAVGTEPMYRAFRTWVLHVWELAGAPHTWGDQLAARYREQPVFAVIGGLGGGSWQAVHAFCETFEVPCVFPDVDYPDVAGKGHYALYFSRALTLEAEVLGRHLQERAPSDAAPVIVQVYRDDAAGRVPAEALRRMLAGRWRVVDCPLPADGRLPDDCLPAGAGRALPDAVVLWLDHQALAALGALPAGAPGALYASSSLLAMHRPKLPDAWLARLRMVHPFDLPPARERRMARLQAWLRARGIPEGDQRTQANAFFAATIAGDALSHVGETFSRDYFIERIEQMTQASLSPSIYPHLSLGPGQRFASKGAYVVEFPAEADGAPVAVSGWLIP
jgi:hypothetical protein